MLITIIPQKCPPGKYSVVGAKLFGKDPCVFTGNPNQVWKNRLICVRSSANIPWQPYSCASVARLIKAANDESLNGSWVQVCSRLFLKKEEWHHLKSTGRNQWFNLRFSQDPSLAESLCIPCPAGASCPGGSEVAPISGFWSENTITSGRRSAMSITVEVSSNRSLCKTRSMSVRMSLRWSLHYLWNVCTGLLTLYVSWNVSQVYRCPPGSCLGSGNCSLGNTGPVCGQCRSLMLLLVSTLFTVFTDSSFHWDNFYIHGDQTEFFCQSWLGTNELGLYLLWIDNPDLKNCIYSIMCRSCCHLGLLCRLSRIIF